jgi:hypothetical protein
LLNHVLIGPSWDADHILVAPSGCFVLDSKWSARPWKRDCKELRAAARGVANQADRVRRLLGHDVPVEGLVVLWGEARSVVSATGVGKQDGVRVIDGEHLHRWLLGRPSGALTTERVDRLYEQAAEIALQGDEHEPPTPRSLEEMYNSTLRVAGTATAGLLVPLYAGEIWRALTPVTGAALILLGAVARRRWQVTRTALLAAAGAILTLWVVAVLLDRL